MKTVPPIKYVRGFPVPPGMKAITLPPIAIFVKGGIMSHRLFKHETAHWMQYERLGLFGFYWQYLLGWIKAGFSYRENWMEIEARILSEMDDVQRQQS